MMKASQKHLKTKRKERFDFSSKIISLMMGKKLLCFVDETSFQVTSRARITKTWMTEEQPITHCVNTRGLSSVTIYAACFNFQGASTLHAVEGYKHHRMDILPEGAARDFLWDVLEPRRAPCTGQPLSPQVEESSQRVPRHEVAVHTSLQPIS